MQTEDTKCAIMHVKLDQQTLSFVANKLRTYAGIQRVHASHFSLHFRITYFIVRIITFSCCFYLPEKELGGCTTFTATNETQFVRITKYALLMNNFQYFAVSAHYIGDAHQMMLIW